MTEAGADDAGVGEIYGFAYFAIVVADPSQLQQLQQLPLKDSKRLTKLQIIQLAKKLKTIIKYKILKVSPRLIDRINLNILKFLCFKRLAEWATSFQPTKIVIDCPWPSCEKFKNAFKMQNIVAEHKADTKFTLVKCAAILAKYCYNRQLLELQKRYGNIGSGNLNDVLTKTYCRQNYNQWFIRKKWRIF